MRSGEWLKQRIREVTRRATSVSMETTNTELACDPFVAFGK
jgi:hypothetical protein